MKVFIYIMVIFILGAIYIVRKISTNSKDGSLIDIDYINDLMDKDEKVTDEMLELCDKLENLKIKYYDDNSESLKLEIKSLISELNIKIKEKEDTLTEYKFIRDNYKLPKYENFNKMISSNERMIIYANGFIENIEDFDD